MTQADKFSDSVLTWLRNECDSDCIPISGIRNNRLLDRTLPGELFRLPDDYPEPREILQQHFPLTADECNFSGGWGYDAEHTTIVKEFDPEINPHKKFDGISLEYAFVDKRIWEELVHSRPMDERFQGFSYITVAQYLCDMDGILHDHLVVAVRAFLEKDWYELKADWQEHNEYKNDPKGRKRNLAQRNAIKLICRTEYWFNISDFMSA